MDLGPLGFEVEDLAESGLRLAAQSLQKVAQQEWVFWLFGFQFRRPAHVLGGLRELPLQDQGQAEVG